MTLSAAPPQLPQPLSTTGQVTFDPVTRSVLVRPAEPGLAWLIWRQGHQAMLDDAGSFNGPRPVYARLGNRDVGRGEAVRDGWLRFQLDNDADYQHLARQEGVHAILTVDKRVGTILAVRFIG
jgi:hypothetical protein